MLWLAPDPRDALSSSLPVPAAFLPDGGASATTTTSTTRRDEGAEDDGDNDAGGGDDDDLLPPGAANPRRVRAGRPRSIPRVDALRSLLCSLAPVALDIGARVACLVLTSSSSDDGATLFFQGRGLHPPPLPRRIGF